MPNKGKKKTKKRNVIGGSKQEQQLPTTEISQRAKDAASERFVQDLLVRGDAAERNKDGSVPQQATHAVKRKHPDGSVEVERVRFKIF
jgi:hypothetical protein